MQNEFPSANASPGALLTEVAVFDCSTIDALVLDIENGGGAALTGAEVHARISNAAPWRDITPATFVEVDGFTVMRPSAREIVGLSAGGFVQVFLNVSMFSSVRLMLSGAGAVITVRAGGVK